MPISHQHFKINQRNISVGRAANFPEAAFATKFTRASLGIIGIEMNGVARPVLHQPRRRIHAKLPGLLEEVKVLKVGVVPKALADLYYDAWFVGFVVAFVVYLAGRKLAPESSLRRK